MGANDHIDGDGFHAEPGMSYSSWEQPTKITYSLDGVPDYPVAYDQYNRRVSPIDTSIALKFDDGKPPMSLLPWEALKEVAKVLGFGVKKYAAHNWRKGFKWSRLADAAQRHLSSYCSGERKDPESKLSHLAHCACMVLFLLTHELLGLGEDDMLNNERRPGGEG